MRAVNARRPRPFFGIILKEHNRVGEFLSVATSYALAWLGAPEDTQAASSVALPGLPDKEIFSEWGTSTPLVPHSIEEPGERRVPHRYYSSCTRRADLAGGVSAEGYQAVQRSIGA